LLWWCVLVTLKAEGGHVEGDRAPTDLKKRRQRKKERKHDVPSWLVLAQLLILVYPPPYILLVFLSPLSPAEFRCVPWRARGEGRR